MSSVGQVAAPPESWTAQVPVHVTNVVLLDPVTKQPTRVKRRYTMTGECVRISKALAQNAVSSERLPFPGHLWVSALIWKGFA